jgi:hypothetical protein
MRPKSPYDGLNRASYGPLRTIPPRSCSANDPMIAELSRQITALIARPFASISKVDPSIEHEDLADNFRIPGDPGMPPVTILDRSNDGIVFWHELDLVPISEVAAAAEMFCERRDGRAVWQGSAEQCGAPSQVGLAINGQRPVVIPSQVISAYRCQSGRAAHRQKLMQP